MVTNNFKAFLKTVLQAGYSAGKTLLPVKDVTGAAYYLYTIFGSSSFPYIATPTMRFGNYGNEGVYVGTGNAAATENDYQLQSPITSGLTASTPSEQYGLDAAGNPYRELTYLITNNTAADIVIKEIGFVQVWSAGTTQNSTSNTPRKFLLDRTVLASPLTVPANSSVALKYTLKTIIS